MASGLEPQGDGRTGSLGSRTDGGRHDHWFARDRCMALVTEVGRFEVRIVPDRDRVIVALCGELDMANVDAVQTALNELRAVGWTSLVLDLRELTFIDSTGLS